MQKQLMNPSLSHFIKKRHNLIKEATKAESKSTSSLIETEIDNIENLIQEEVSNSNREKVMKYINKSQKESGVLDHAKFWKLKQRLIPIDSDVPTAKFDEHGKLISDHEKLKKLYLQTYQKRLRHVKQYPQHQEIFSLKTKLWKMRLNILKTNISEDWTLKEVKRAIDSL